MHPLLDVCETWLRRQYQTILGVDLGQGPARLRWLDADAIGVDVERSRATALAIEDADIGWLFFMLPYVAASLEKQVNQAVSLRSRLLRESNYTGSPVQGPGDDQDGAWRVGLVWFVPRSERKNWQDQIQGLRRESGVAEEVSFDVTWIDEGGLSQGLDEHGMPRLLLRTRALMRQCQKDVETWASVDTQVLEALRSFGTRFSSVRTRTYAREIVERASSYRPTEVVVTSTTARAFTRFAVKNFRNLQHMGVVADSVGQTRAQAIILCGPNGTGKSSFAEAVCLAAFGTSPRLEAFMVDDDLLKPSQEIYLAKYLRPFDKLNAVPRFTWGDGLETDFRLSVNGESKCKFDGVVLNQEDSREFTDLTRAQLAARVLKGYSGLAESLIKWLTAEELRAKDVRQTFARANGLSAAVTRSSTAYKGLALGVLRKHLKRPSPEFLDWLRFWGRGSDDNGRKAAQLVAQWSVQDDTGVERVSTDLAKQRERGGDESLLGPFVLSSIDAFNAIARRSGDLRQSMESRILGLRDQLDTAISQVNDWGTWLASRSESAVRPADTADALQREMERLSKERVVVEDEGRNLRGRLDFLDHSKQFLTTYWVSQHPNTCPLCNSDLQQRFGIDVVVKALQEEIAASVQQLLTRVSDIQNQQHEIETKLRAAGLVMCSVSSVDQARLRDLLSPFLPVGVVLEDWLVLPDKRDKLKEDLRKMKVLPDAPRAYADGALVVDVVVKEFLGLCEEADRALEDPQAIADVRKVFEQCLEDVLKVHLPSTLGAVWQEITLSLTTARWVLPGLPSLSLGERGKALSVQTRGDGRLIRYLYNAAERHALGLAWFFTYYLARQRFHESWVFLDDPAQEMDQPSFREFARFGETLLRLHQRVDRAFTFLVGLHQEERALSIARATNGKLYMLGWDGIQEDAGPQSSVKKLVLLAPGFHPRKPEMVFREQSPLVAPVSS